MDAQRERVRSLLTRSDTVVFVGSGVSLWSGLPSWTGLIEALAAYLARVGRDPALTERELARGDLLQAASFGFMDLTKPERREFLREVLRVGDAMPSALHRRIATLGPTSFITTNYDKLLERALVEEGVDRGQFRMVSTTSLVEVANIVGAQAHDFVFKPHGDVDMSDTVILTREDYRELRGPRVHVFEAMKTLLASRPVIFIGFGLRDPDFLLMKDALAEVYGGAAQDHYALMPDVVAEEARYWRTSYGMHLVSYESGPFGGSVGGHGALLELLEDLAVRPPTAAVHAASRAEQALSLLRHAKRVQSLPDHVGELIPVHGAPRRGSEARLAPFYRFPAVEALAEVVDSMVLVGPPGAGKSVVARAAVARMAFGLIDELLTDDGEEHNAPVPIYIDLKEYDGDLWGLVAASLPVGIELETLIDERDVRCVLDGVNEIPHGLLESNQFADDLEDFVSRMGDSTVLLVSRFVSGLEPLELPVIDLELIDLEWLVGRLHASGVPTAGMSDEMLTLLQRPLYFRLFEREGWSVEELRSPHAAYSRLMLRLSHDAGDRFGTPVDLLDVFAALAFERVEAGGQRMALTDVLRHVGEALGSADVSARDVVDWLISEQVLVAAPGDLVLFFHHSITEYLAGFHLARRYQEDAAVLHRCLQQRQWDHAILLALGFLSPDGQRAFLTTVIGADAAVAVRAMAFVEDGDGRCNAMALDALQDLEPVAFGEQFGIGFDLSRIVFAPGDEERLWRLVQRDDVIGSGAAEALLRLSGREVLPRVMDRVFGANADFNFRANIDVSDLMDSEAAADMLARMESDVVAGAAVTDLQDEPALLGLREFAAKALSEVGLDTVRERWPDITAAPLLVRATVLEYARLDASEDSFAAIVDLLPADGQSACFALYWRLRYPSDEGVEAPTVDVERVGPLLLDLVTAGSDHWPIDTLRELSRRSTAWQRWTSAQAALADDVAMRAALYYAAGSNAEFFTALAQLLDDPEGGFDIGAAKLLQACSVSWRGREELLVALLGLRQLALTGALLESVFMTVHPLLEPFPLEDLEWWVAQLEELADDDASLVGDRFGSFLATVLVDEQLAVLLGLLTSMSSARRHLVTDLVLTRVSGLTLDDLSQEALQMLFDDLSEHRITHLAGDGGLLGAIATEAYVESQVLPALATASGVFRGNLVDIAIEAGHRHGRRYVSTTGELLD